MEHEALDALITVVAVCGMVAAPYLLLWFICWVVDRIFHNG